MEILNQIPRFALKSKKNFYMVYGATMLVVFAVVLVAKLYFHQDVAEIQNFAFQKF